MTKSKETSGRAAPETIEPRPSGDGAPTATPVAGKWSGLIPAGIVLGLMALAILLTYLTD